MTLEEAKAKMTPAAYEKLSQLVTEKPTICMDNKINNDILMGALCKAVNDEVIKSTSLDERLIKLLNSSTNTLSQAKLIYVLDVVHKSQPDVKCIIKLLSSDMETVIKSWVYSSPYDVKLNDMFEYVIKHFKITPSDVRNKMCETLKETIVNNVSQLVSKYLSFETEEEKNSVVISIMTINRLVNMENHILTAEFVKQ